MIEPANGGSKLLFWILGIAIMVLFAAIGLIVQDVRADIEENRKSLFALERQILTLQGDVKEEQRLTQQIREWHFPRLSHMEERLNHLERATRIPGKPEEGR